MAQYDEYVSQNMVLINCHDLRDRKAINRPKAVDLTAYLARERRLLYVAMTRACDLLYVTCSRGQPSRFLSSVPEEYLKRK